MLSTLIGRQQKLRRLLILLTVIVVIMFGFGFALVPIYNVLCKQLGINGKTAGQAAASHIVDEKRWVTIEFLATNNQTLPWDFHPNQKKIRFHPGEMKRVSYFAKNTTDNIMMVQAIPSVTPSLAAKYLKKTECFCFTQQTLAGHTSMDMPILFHIDPALPENIHTVTLSYTLFDVTNMDIKTKDTGRINS